MRLRRLTPQGIAQFSEYLDLLENEPTRLVPTHLLEDAASSELIDPPVEVERKSLSTRYAAAEYLDSILSKAGIADAERDIGLGAWLTLFFFDELRPKDNKTKFPLERAAYIPEPQNYKRYYRHRIFGPCLIFRAHRDNPKRAMALLCQPLHIVDDIIGQLAAYQEIVSNKSIVEMATHLYLDPTSGERKKGAGGKGPGSPRRLAAVLDQFDVTWDLYAMSLKEFWAVLPKEFEKFRPATP